MLKAIQRKANAVAESFRVPKDKYPVLKLRDTYTPALYNNPELVNKVIPNFEKLFGKDKIVKVEPTMGGEDFSRYGENPRKRTCIYVLFRYS